MADDEAPDSLLDIPDAPRSAALAARRTALVVVLLFVVAGLVGVWGVHRSVAHASGDGYTMTLEFPRVARAGLDVPWRVHVHHPGGFDGPITLAVTQSYFDMFEQQGFHPEPSSATASDGVLYLEFDPPPGETFMVSWDAYIQPGAQLGKNAQVALIIDGAEVTSLQYRTWLMP